MGQFKPMVKMETTEPSVELKLKKGGSVAHKKMKKGGTCKETGHKMMDGGMPVAMPGAPMITPRRAAAARAIGRPSLAARRAAMSKAGARGALAGAPVMKKGGTCKATGGVVKGQGGYKTGGVVKGQGGYADGGIIKSTSGVTKVVSATSDKSPAKTGDVKLGNGGGYKKGGKTKKFAEGGSVNDAGRPQKMPQGNKTPSKPVSISKLAGTFKKGGKVAAKSLEKQFKTMNAPAVKAAKADNDLKYSQYQKGGTKVKKFADGGLSTGVNSSETENPSPPYGMGQGGMGIPTPQAMMGRHDYRDYMKSQGQHPDMNSWRQAHLGNPRGVNYGTGYKDMGENYGPAEAPVQNTFGVAPKNIKSGVNPLAVMKRGGNVKKYADGGYQSYDESFESPREQLSRMRMRKDIERGIGATSDAERTSNEELLNFLSNIPEKLKDLIRGSGAVTDTKTTVSRTVAPAKKRGGKVKK